MRGIDVCNDELGVPNWVFAPLFIHVREAADIAAGAIRRRFGRTVPRLRTTVHAGEDFVHLQTGLRCSTKRSINSSCAKETASVTAWRSGIDPRDWARRTGRVAVAVEDRLLDLIWEWTCYGEDHLRVVDGVVQSLEYEIADITRKMFGRHYSPHDLAYLRDCMANKKELKAVGFPRSETLLE